MRPRTACSSPSSHIRSRLLAKVRVSLSASRAARRTLTIARALKEICGEAGVPLVFKASYDKANRTSIDSFRGIGMEEALGILAEVKETVGVPLVSDVHDITQVERAAETLDGSVILP